MEEARPMTPTPSTTEIVPLSAVELDAAASERARDMFHHPFAHCADKPNLEDVLLAA
jgi:hypothetical protein